MIRHALAAVAALFLCVQADAQTSYFAGVAVPDPLPGTVCLVVAGDCLASAQSVPPGQHNWILPSQGSSLPAGWLDPHISSPITNRGVANTTMAQIATSVTAESTGQKACIHLVWGGVNDLTNTGGVPDIASYMLTNMATVNSAITGPLYIYGITPKSARLSPTDVRRMAANRAVAAAYPNQFIDIAYTLERGGMGTPNDNKFFWSGLIPESEHETHDGTHLGGIDGITGKGGTGVLADLTYQLLGATQGYAPYVTPFKEIYLSGSAATAAQANGGAIGSTMVVGSPISYTVSGGGGNFAIDGAGNIIHANSSALTAAWYDLTVAAANQYGVGRGAVRVYVGAPDTSSPVMANVNGTIGFANPVISRDSNFGTAVQHLSIAALVKGAGSTGRLIDILSSANPERFYVTQSLGGGQLQLFGANSSGTTVVSSTSGSTDLSSGTSKWVFISIDLTTGTCSFGVDDGTTYTAETMTTCTSGGSLDLSGSFDLLFGTAANTAGPLSLPWTGGIEELWVSAGSTIDFMQSSNRQMFHASGALTPVNLGSSGTVSSIIPDVYLAGSLGDLAYGKNRGALGDFVNWLTNDGSGVIN